MVKPSFVTNHLKRVHTGKILYNVKKSQKTFPIKHKVVDILVLWVKQSQLQFFTSVLVVQKQPQKRYKKMSEL